MNIKKFNILIFILLLYVFSDGTICYAQMTANETHLADSITNTIQKRRNLRVKNPEGEEFWLCFEKNYKESKKQSQSTELQLELFITGDENANVVIEIDGIGYKHKEFVAGGTVKNVKIPAEAQVKSEEIVERLALHITSDKPISVYGLNRRFQTTDTYLGLPTSVLGTEYRAMCYTVSEGLMPQFAIVATEDNTEITITPTVATTLHAAKKPFTIYLKRGDVYQVASRNEPFSDCDLTGSLIKSNKKISVFSGHQCAYVTPKIIACNHLVEQLPPIPSWGKHFYIGKFLSRSKYTFRVLANEPYTKIFQDTKLVRILKEGEFFDTTVATDAQISASKPVLVAQFSQGFKNGDSIGDPMMLLISPTQQFLQQYRFATPINGFWKHCINVVAPTKGIGTMKLNGEPIDPKKFKPLGISRYSIAYLTVPFGSHLIDGDLPFGMYSYGFGYDKDSYDAYGTMGGQSFMEYEPVNDTLPPMVEEQQAGNNLSLILRDDRVDDAGMKDIIALDRIGLELVVPPYEEGVPQLKVNIRPTKTGNGRMVVQVRDVALNKEVYTICYSYDGKTDKYVYMVNKGIEEDCNPDPGFQYGLFGKISGIYQSSDFGTSGNISTRGKFSDAFGTGGYCGLYFGRRYKAKWLFSGRLSFENYGGTLEAPDTFITHVRVKNGDLKPFQESTLLKLDGTFMNLGLAAEYYLKPNLYVVGGFSLAFTLSESIDYQRRINQPAEYTYLDGSRQTHPENGPSKLTSLNFMRLGFFGGFGFTQQINYMFSAFAETNYSYSIGDMISDGHWNIHQLSFMLGIKMRY